MPSTSRKVIAWQIHQASTTYHLIFRKYPKKRKKGLAQLNRIWLTQALQMWSLPPMWNACQHSHIHKQWTIKVLIEILIKKHLSWWYKYNGMKIWLTQQRNLRILLNKQKGKPSTMIESIIYRHTFVRNLVCHCIIFLPPTCRK